MKTHFFRILSAVFLVTALAGNVCAQEPDSKYCFSAGDFPESITGVCLTRLPETREGALMLGTRVLRTGDILTAEQAARMVFVPTPAQQSRVLEVSYLPILETHVDAVQTAVLSIAGKEDLPPVAEDSAGETYKNLPNTGTLKVQDPEGQPLTFTVARQPRRGTVEIAQDGSFTYTPKKNKVGIDSFTYTASDPAGNVSREATVTMTILKPSEAPQYADTAGQSYRFAAEWMKNTGIFVGETLNGTPCFQPEKPVTRGEFLSMLVKALEIPTQEELTVTGCTDEIPSWLRPYLTAAIRSGLTAGLPNQTVFGADAPVSGGEAAVMLQNALELAPVSQEEAETVPTWAGPALSALEEAGIVLSQDDPLTRGQAAEILYTVHQTASA